jgi:hypothetical protein
MQTLHRSGRVQGKGENQWRMESFLAGSATDVIKPRMPPRQAAAVRQNVTGLTRRKR